MCYYVTMNSMCPQKTGNLVVSLLFGCLICIYLFFRIFLYKTNSLVLHYFLEFCTFIYL